MDTSKNPEILRDRTKDILSQQLDSKKEIQGSAGIIVGFTPVFFTVFIYALDKTSAFYRIISLIPFVFLIIGIYKLIFVLKKHRMDIGYGEQKIDELLNKDTNDVLLFEISANKNSIIKNDLILNKIETIYNKSIKFIVYSLVSILIVLFTSIFIPSIDSIMSSKKENPEMKKTNKTENTIKDTSKIKDNKSGFSLPDVDDDDLKALNNDMKSQKAEKSNKKDK